MHYRWQEKWVSLTKATALTLSNMLQGYKANIKLTQHALQVVTKWVSLTKATPLTLSNMSLTCIKTGRCGSCYASTASHLHQHISIDVAGAGGTHCSCRINVGILVSQRTTADRHVTKHWNMGYTHTHTRLTTLYPELLG